ncbi:MAG: amidohydrolase family protein [Verrucomicrobiae bacterium]|nr:amidohydrolase family protein [Verrucomicrobiae bacterium]
MLLRLLFLFCFPGWFCSGLLLAENHLDFLASIKKIDVHTHERADEPLVREVLDEDSWKYVNICVDSGNKARTDAQRNISLELYQKYPRYFSWITAFTVEGIWEPGWQQRVIAQLRQDFKNGAIGVKVWKHIGMGLQDPDGNYVQLDHPIFAPVFDFIAEQDKTLIAHMGEPIHAWMPTYTTEDGIPKNYWATHPEYSFYDKPELPSYSDIMAARDHVVRNHPKLRFVGAHMASLEFDVAEIATRMEMFPNFAVELGGRARWLQWQARGKVRAFFMKYQDRIMYGTDLGVSSGMTDKERILRKERIKERNTQFATYLATDQEIPFGDLLREDRPVRGPEYYVTGLALPPEVLKKVYYDNALVWFPGVAKDYGN